MKKTISINLGGRNFYIEEDAFAKLDAYLHSVKAYFAAYPDHDEIIADMESRMAEKFFERKNPNSAITSEEVDALIATMGKVEDFSDSAKTSSNTSHAANAEAPRTKKLYRNPDDVIIAGVCSGLAAYFGIDAALIRILFAVSVFFGGFGVVFYIILWIVMPEAKTTTEKIQMAGEPVTLASLEQKVKETAEDLKKNGKAQKIVRGPATFLRKLLNAFGIIIKALAKLLVKLLGLVLIVGATLGIAGLLFLLLTLLFNFNSPYVDFPLRSLVFDWRYYVAGFAAFFAIAIPLSMLGFAGSSLLRQKPAVNRTFSLSLLAAWIVAVAMGGSLALRLAPEIQAKMEQDPQFKTVSRTFDYKDFTKVKAGDALRVTIVQGDSFAINANGRQADLDRLVFKQSGDELTVNQHSYQKICIFCSYGTTDITIQMPTVNAVEASGAVRIESSGIRSTQFTLALSGASRAYLTLDAKDLTAHLSGASRVEINGTTTATSLTLSGASRAYINSAKSLNITASGASKVYYSGNPTITSRLSGASRVIEQEPPIPQAPNEPEFDTYDLRVQ